MRAIHKIVGKYTVCGRRVREHWQTTVNDSEVTCLYCKSGGIGAHKAILKESPKESQEELWKAVSNEINDEGLWLYEDWDGFKLTAKGYKYLMQQFTITRKK